MGRVAVAAVVAAMGSPLHKTWGCRQAQGCDLAPLGCHRPRTADRNCLEGIPARLVTGCSWDVAARLCWVSRTTLRGRRTEWLAAGVCDKLVEEAIAGYDKIISLELSEVAVGDSRFRRAHTTAPLLRPSSRARDSSVRFSLGDGDGLFRSSSIASGPAVNIEG